MDLSFAKPDDPIVLQQIIDRILMGLNTAIPATIRAFDPVTQTVTAIPNIKAINHTIDGKTFTSALPELIQVPCFLLGSSSSGMTITIPIKKNDQCLIIFSQRSIDNWFKYSGVQDPVETLVPRHHSLADGIALVGLYPKPQKITEYNNDAIEIRDGSRSNRITMEKDLIEIQSCSISPQKLWNSTDEFKAGDIVYKIGGGVYTANEDNTGNEPPSSKWDTAPVSKTIITGDNILCETGSVSLQLEGENIILKGKIIIDGTIEGVGGTPVLTTAGISHSSKVINSSHQHSGVTGGTGNSGGVA